MSDFIKRAISGILGIFSLILIISKGGLLVSFSILIISLIGLKELFDALKENKLYPLEALGYFASLGIFLTNVFKPISMAFVITLTIIILFINIIFNKNSNIENISLTLFSILYIPFLLNHINYLNNTKYIWLIFLIGFGADTFAYLTGNLIGKKKLCPNISPHKTVEGFFGGIIGSIIISLIYAKYVKIHPLGHIILLSIIGSIIAQFGDLFASKIKRVTKIKDFGFIMPGHGGILDRFDSIILSCPVIYYYIKYFLI